MSEERQHSVKPKLSEEEIRRWKHLLADRKEKDSEAVARLIRQELKQARKR